MKYNITNSNILRVFSCIKKELEESNQTINELLKIDHKYCRIKVDLKMLTRVIDLLKNEELNIQEEQKIIIKYNGDPCITLNLSILAILTKNIVILDYKKIMTGINSLIIKIVNNVLGKFKTDKLIYLINENNYEEKNVDKIICIDDINKYNTFLRENNKKAKFYSHNYLDLYSDSDEYEEIEELIYKFAEENQIQIEVYSELELKDAVQMIKDGLGKIAVVLTNNKQTEQVFANNIKNKELYINKNPFKQEIKLLDKEILHM